MKFAFVLRASALAGFALAFNSVASASPSWQFAPATYGGQSAQGPAVTPANDNYTFYSGVGRASDGQLFLIENTTTPTFDDIVSFNGVAESINPYVTTIPTPRTVTESDTVVDATHRKISITVTTTAGNDLWPTGFADQNNAPLTAGGFGIGFSGVPSIWGAGGEPLGWDGALITASDMDIIDTSGVESGNTGPLPVTGAGSFFPGNGAGGWTGVFGVSFTDTFPTGVTGFGVTSIKLNFTYVVVPEPMSLAMLMPLSGLMLRRRR